MTEVMHAPSITDSTLTKQDLVDALSLDDFSQIYNRADTICNQTKGNIIDIRCIVEFSNYCWCACAYCGLNCNNTFVDRYRMSPQEIIQTVAEARNAGYLTVVLQSGEDPHFTAKILGSIVKEIKKLEMHVTLGCGEMSREDYAHLRNCGADRFLLKHETSDEVLYNKLHPHSTFENRIRCLRDIKSLGFETGSGFMVGLPTQTIETIANDILLLKELQCDMAGIGPFIPHPKTLLGGCASGSTELTRRAVALTRILLPECNLPATTALGVLNKTEKDAVFSGGANVIMKKVTPNEYKAKYEIYPSSMSKTDIVTERQILEEQIRALGKIPR